METFEVAETLSVVQTLWVVAGGGDVTIVEPLVGAATGRRLPDCRVNKILCVIFQLR